MGVVAAFCSGVFASTWKQCLVLAAIVAAGDLLIVGVSDGKSDSVAYMVGYLTMFFVFDVAVAVVGHGLRRLFVEML